MRAAGTGTSGAGRPSEPTDGSPAGTAGPEGAAVRTNGRRSTATYRFGAARRESHDASDFYQRFPVPAIEADDRVSLPASVDRIWTGDARAMDAVGDVADGSVALVVTSPPYFAGKEYEAAMGEGHVPESYRAFLAMLADVFAECARKLEPGGRMAVNVANLGRKPYRSLSADVIDILQRLGLLLRGEIIWVKGKAAGGSCAWGSFQRPSNPVLRDLTERIIVASKGRFDRAVPARRRVRANLPSEPTVTADEFMDLTYDVWELAPESARRVGHPAPFPVELPRRFIELYTYRGDLVLDPFMGAGSTAVAAVRTGRHYVGFDTDPDYVAGAEARVASEREALARVAEDERGVVPPPAGTSTGIAAGVPGAATPSGDAGDPGLPVAVVEALEAGRKVTDVVHSLLREAGWSGIEDKVKAGPGLEFSFRARDAAGRPWLFDVVGSFSAERPGLRRNDVLWRAVGRASVLAATPGAPPLVLLSPDLPEPASPGGRALASVCGEGGGATVAEVIRLVDLDGFRRLRKLRG